MKTETIMKSFQATGVLSMDAEVVLKRFNNHTSEQDTGTEIKGRGDGDSWNQLRKTLDAAVEDKSKVVSKRLAASVHSLQVNNHLLHIENNGLQRALYTKKKQKEKSSKLNLQQRQEYHSGTVFWSPRKLCEARAHEKIEQDDAEQKKTSEKQDKGDESVGNVIQEKYGGGGRGGATTCEGGARKGEESKG
jgi:hypothetical protein